MNTILATFAGVATMINLAAIIKAIELGSVLWVVIFSSFMTVSFIYFNILINEKQ